MKPRLVLAIFPLAFLALFFAYPLYAILTLSLFPQGTLELSGVRELVSDPYYARVLWFTIWQAALSTMLTVGAALPAAFVFARFHFRFQTLWRALTTIPFLMPTVVVAAAFNTMLGPRGWVNLLLMNLLNLPTPPIDLLNTVWIILLAHAFYNFTIVFRMVGGFWSNLDPQLEDAARVLGASRLRAWVAVTLPLLAPSIIAAALLVFIFDFTSFGIVLILGGPRLATLEVEIFRQTVNIFNLPLAATLAVLQMLSTGTLMFVYARLQGKLALPLRLRPRAAAQRPVRIRYERILVSTVLVLMVVLLLSPLLTLLIESVVTSGGIGLENYASLSHNPRGSVTFVAPVEAVRNSLFFAAGVVLLALALGLCAAYSLGAGTGRQDWLLDAIYMLPLGTSGVTLGFGFILALDRPPLDLRTSLFLIPIAHALVAFPFVVRSILPILRSIKPNLRDAARVLGAYPLRVWWEVDLPIVARAAVVGAVFAFVVSLGEFAATSLIALPEFPTLPIAIYRLLGQPGIANYGQAIALSVILMVISSVPIVLMEQARVGTLGEF